MMDTGLLRRLLFSAGLSLLALSVFTLATQSKTAQYGSEHHITSHYKATDSLEHRLKIAPGAEAEAPRVPARLDAPVFHAEFHPPAPEVRHAFSPWLAPSQLLRAPPAR